MAGMTILWLCFFLLYPPGRVLAQLQTFTPPGQSAIAYSVNIPSSTAASSSGPIFIQLQSTEELQWFAFGQGAVMQGANIFVVYATKSNITVSPRLGIEHVEPLYNPQAKISLLNGSGIQNGHITANIRCDSCITWSGGHEDLTSTSSPWVWAIKYGPLLDSNSITETITIHDISGVASLNLQKATGGNPDNPFLGESSMSSSSASALTTFNSSSINKKRIAHAVIMLLTFVIFLPLAALGVPLLPSSKTIPIHACIQLFNLALVITGLGIGVSMATGLQLTGSYHPIIGIVTVSCLVLFQPALGILQHWYFGQTGKKSAAAYLHRWLGRILITLGMINGGLGFRLTGIGTSIAPLGAVIAYGVVAGLIWLGYVVAVTLVPYLRRRRRP